MKAARKDVVRIEGNVAQAHELRETLLRVRDLLPEGEDRDNITALAVHLRYAIEDVIGNRDIAEFLED